MSTQTESGLSETSLYIEETIIGEEDANWTTGQDSAVDYDAAVDELAGETGGIDDDPAADETAGWSAATVYTGGETVSFGGAVYRANWWTQGNSPLSNSGPYGSGQPWTLVSGTIDAGQGETPGDVGTPDDPVGGTGDDPAADETAGWSAATVYTGGETVSFGGAVYRANWWTQGNSPLSNSGPYGSGQPWTLVSGTIDAGQGETPGDVGTPDDPVGGTGDDPAADETAGWSAATVYTGGETVSFGGALYRANWWTQGNSPLSNSGPYGSGQPWTLVSGTIDAGQGETPGDDGTPDDLAGGTGDDPAPDETAGWSAATVYTGGETVSFGGAIYRANWWTQGNSPLSNSGPYGSGQPWTLVSGTIDAGQDETPGDDGTPDDPAGETGASDGGVNANLVFAPYIDICLGVDVSLAAISQETGIDVFTLGFIQSSGADSIGWAGYGNLSTDYLYIGLSVEEKIDALRAVGGDVIISFGGAAGIDPAANSSSAASLQSLYQSVIDLYDVSSLDFDVEGGQLVDQESIALRNQALIGLQEANPDLEISFTLPVLPTGLTQDGVNLLYSLKDAGVDVDVINIMVMDYGSAVDQGGQMGKNAIDAIQATQRQLVDVDLEALLGVTPMIGVNDIPSEIFTLADAQMLYDYVMANENVARLSMWSVSRDNGDGAGSYWASPTTSGIEQTPYQFSSLFAQV